MDAVTEQTPLGHLEVLANIPGLTYRQLDFWTRNDYIHAIDRGPKASSGIHRKWTPAEAEITRRMYRLVTAGFNVATAAELARHPERLEAMAYYLTRFNGEHP